MDTVEQSTGWEVINGFFDVSTETAGAPLEFRIFDPQYCDHLQEDWLAGAVASSGISRDELDGMIQEDLPRFSAQKARVEDDASCNKIPHKRTGRRDHVFRVAQKMCAHASNGCSQ